MSHLICQMLLLVCLSTRDAFPIKGSNDTLICGYDINCQAIMKLMSTVNEINDKLDKSESHPNLSEKLDKLATRVHDIQSKQVKDVELLTVNMNSSLASTAAISTQLERQSADLLRYDERLKTHDLFLTNMYELMQSIYWTEMGPRDCTDIRKMGFNISGVYRVYTRRVATDVYCDLSVPTESWLVFQRRRDGSQNFARTWLEYAYGFGVLNGEFWLGNEKLCLLTMNKKYKLRIELEDFTGERRWAEYSTFSVKPSSDKYRLTVGGYSGNSGDSLIYHNNMMFTTKDQDNDAAANYNCVEHRPGGWWFNACHHSNLNGLYIENSNIFSHAGIHWAKWKENYHSLKATEMKITAVY